MHRTRKIGLCVVLLQSSRSRSRSSTAIEWDRNRDLSYSIFADFCWAMASIVMQSRRDGCTRLRGDWSVLHNGMTSADVRFTLTFPPLPHACQTARTAYLWNALGKLERSERLISMDRPVTLKDDCGRTTGVNVPCLTRAMQAGTRFTYPNNC